MCLTPSMSNTIGGAQPPGLIISEATQVVPEEQGYPTTPGIHSPQQIAGWRKVTDAVREAGGRK